MGGTLDGSSGRGGSTETRPITSLAGGGFLEFEDGKRIEITEEPTTIGRNRENTVCFDDSSVSAVHCELRLSKYGVVLRDLGSRNGTFLGKTRVIEVVLGDAVTIAVGGKSFRFLPSARSVSSEKERERDRLGFLFGAHPRMQKLYRVIEAVAPTQLSVLVLAETGTGKELVARSIHAESPRASGPFVVVDCGALPSTLAESILFGHEKGSFTGASARTDGAFREASGGTLFLDELGELPEEVQPKLLRAVAERTIKRVGGSRYDEVDVRIVAATRRDLRIEMNAQRFREDLFFRLAQVKVELPPLRERISDIPLIAREVCRKLGAMDAAEHVVAHIESRFRAYDWPGNVRELVNVASVLASIGAAETSVLFENLGESEGAPESDPKASPEEFLSAKRTFEERYFRRLLGDAEGNISEVSRRSGLARHQVRHHLRKLGLV
jgi:DNA-binding NtrC family response regulator